MSNLGLKMAKFYTIFKLIFNISNLQSSQIANKLIKKHLKEFKWSSLVQVLRYWRIVKTRIQRQQPFANGKCIFQIQIGCGTAQLDVNVVATPWILFRKYLRNYSRNLTIFNCVGSSFDACFCPYDWICSNRKIGKLAPEITRGRILFTFLNIFFE